MKEAKGTVLIVDDEDSVRYVLARELKALGYEPVTATGGREALANLSSQRFSLVMLDVKMPGMSGLEVLAKLRRSHPSTAVAMLSAIADTDIAAEALRLGADDYLTKPWSSEDLGARVNGVLARKGKPASGEEGASEGPESGPRSLDAGEITKDLISQQVTLYERLASGFREPGQEKPKRRWWPWGKKS